MKNNIEKFKHLKNGAAPGDICSTAALPPKVIYAGFDALDVSYMGCLSLHSQNQLEKAKEEAQESKAETLVKLGPGMVEGHVGETGAQGGYRWKLDTGPTGEIWFFKRSANKQDWNIRVSVRAAQLVSKTWQEVRDDLTTRLNEMGCDVIQESIARVDFAIDFLAPDFVLEPENFICAHQSTRSVYGDTLRNVNPKAQEAHDPTLCNEGEGESLIHYKGRNVGSVTIGKMPGRQVIMYNKRTEVIQKHHHKSYWWDVWGLDKDDKENQVWRVEIRAGKAHLKEHWNLSTWEQFGDYITNVLEEALDKVRYVVPNEDSNASRWPTHFIWHEAKRVISCCLAPHKNKLITPGKVIEARRDKIAATYEGLMVGLVASYSVAMGYPVDELKTVGRRLKWMVESFIKDFPKEFEEKRKRASDKFIFTDERRHDADANTNTRPNRPGHYRPRKGQHTRRKGKGFILC